MTESGTSLKFSAYDFVVTDRSRTKIEGTPAKVGLREVGLLCDEGISLLSEKQLASQIKGFRKRERHPEQHELRPSVGTMRRIILIFIMCDLALACFAAHELQMANRRRGADNCCFNPRQHYFG